MAMPASRALRVYVASVTLAGAGMLAILLAHLDARLVAGTERRIRQRA